MNKLYSIMVLLALCYTVNAQNVGVGTTNPNARLHVNGVIKTDSTLVVKPSTKAASNGISIGKNDGFVTISNTANAQSNAISMSGTPRPGQWLGISNQDDDDASFASTTIAAGTVGFFIYDGTAWKPLQNGTGSSTALDSLTDADGDTKIQVEATPDEDRIRLIIPAGAYPQEWVFNYNNLIPPQLELISIGENAGKNLIGDEYSTIVIGRNAGYNLTDEVTGVTVLGNNALTSAGEIERSTAIGKGSLEFAKGSENTALGSDAGSGSSSGYSGSGNTFIGTFSGYKAAGSNNAFLGASAGYNATGSSNVFLGTSAGYYETGSNKLYIENSRSSSPLIYGEFDSNLVRINGTFDINNAYHFPLADGTNGQVLSTNGSGQLSWATLSSNSIADADNDTKIQVEESADEDIIRFDLGGTEKWLMTGNRLEPSSDNTLVGQSAGTAITSGTGNTAYGANALKANTTAANNSAFGFNALLSATTGQYNGAYGTNAGYSLTTGNQNVFVGNSAGYTNSIGSNNTFIGQYAGFSNTGSGNVFIGRNAGGSETGSNKLYISNSNDASPLIYGEFDNDKLTFNAQIRVNGITEINGGLRPYSDNTRELGSSSKRWLAVYSTNGTIQTSDARFKTNVIDMEYGLDQLMQLRSVTYNWKEDSTGATKLGFIAQELEQVIPEVVMIGDDSLQTRGVNYPELIPVLVNAIQEQQSQIEDYKMKIENAARTDAAQNQKLADLEAQLRLLLKNSENKKYIKNSEVEIECVRVIFGLYCK